MLAPSFRYPLIPLSIFLTTTFDTSEQSARRLAETMKIFNWVHRRFNHNFFNCSTFPLHKDEFTEDVKKVEALRGDTDTKALLEHVTMVDMVDGWKDGILTIGTLGFDSLKSFNEQEYLITDEDDEDEDENEDYSFNDANDDDDHVEDECELNPLVFTAFRNGFEKDFGSNPNTNITNNPDMILNVDCFPITPLVFPELINVHQDNIENDQRKKKGERTTLADLFSADSDMKRQPDPNKVKPEPSKKPTTKNGISFAKKLIPRADEDSHPIKKLHQLMRRMLKRKIHPELEGKIHKTDGQIKSTVLGLLPTNELRAKESVSLLQNKDATI